MASVMVSTSSFVTLTPHSYQVPQEVGKVGTESPAFVEPVETRKDGIQAMFSKQIEAKKNAVKGAPSPIFKRSPSPSTISGPSQKRVIKVSSSPARKRSPSPIARDSPSCKKARVDGGLGDDDSGNATVPQTPDRKKSEQVLDFPHLFFAGKNLNKGR
jgi:hypothetical protein